MTIANSTKTTLYIIAVLTAALIAMYQWGSYLVGGMSNEEIPEFNQCDKVFVGKIPYVCNPGELIYIDAEVADQFCTEQVFVRTDKSVYCIYNGERPDRDTPVKRFTKRTDNK